MPATKRRPKARHRANNRAYRSRQAERRVPDARHVHAAAFGLLVTSRQDLAPWRARIARRLADLGYDAGEARAVVARMTTRPHDEMAAQVAAEDAAMLASWMASEANVDTPPPPDVDEYPVPESE